MPKKKSSQKPQENVSPFRKLREQANLTQEQLSVRLDISTSTLRRWENGKVEPSMTHQQWVIFCEEVGVPFEKLPEKLNLQAKQPQFQVKYYPFKTEDSQSSDED